MFDYDVFANMTIKEVALAVYVESSMKPDEHTNRPYQGLVINEPHGRRIYYFSDGRELLTEGGDIFFLPKGSTYKVVPLHNMTEDAGCYAINFDADISSLPFAVKTKNTEYFYNLFDKAARLWQSMDKTANNYVRRAIYDVILSLEKEQRKAYMPTERERIIQPGVEKMMTSYTEQGITVGSLAALCGVSEVYFRRLFLAKYGVSPKEYLINLRINYAKQLLSSGEFSVSRVAELCGYPEPCHFSREFSRIVGVAPSDYKI